MTAEERDINDLFNDIVLIEENLSKQSYNEGFAEGQTEGYLEGYKLGYTQGVDLGGELGTIYGTIVGHLQLSHSEKVHKTLEHLRETIDRFPQTNDPEADIIAEIQSIRTQFKKVKAMLKLSNVTPDESKASASVKDFSF